jgi:ribosomal protein S24E
VFIKKLETKTGTQIAMGFANIYEDENVKILEAEHITKRNSPPTKPPEEEGE